MEFETNESEPLQPQLNARRSPILNPISLEDSLRDMAEHSEAIVSSTRPDDIVQPDSRLITEPLSSSLVKPADTLLSETEEDLEEPKPSKATLPAVIFLLVLVIALGYMVSRGWFG